MSQLVKRKDSKKTRFADDKLANESHFLSQIVPGRNDFRTEERPDGRHHNLVQDYEMRKTDEFQNNNSR
jgi:hypothetical protein